MSECQPIQIIDPEDDAVQKEITALIHAFNETPGLNLAGEGLINRSYNPVIDRWRIQRAWATGDSSKIEDETQHIRANIHTNLQERMQAVETYGKFEIKGGKLYSELLPNESFGQVILRGANYRATHGSLEQEREGIKGELGGWLEIQKALAEGIVGTRVISLSPKGRIDKTAYDGNYVDIYEKVGAQEVKRTRISVNFQDKDYLAVASVFDPNVEQKQRADGRSLDAWYLAHPIVITDKDQKLPPMLRSDTIMSQAEFSSLYNTLQRSGLIDYYLHIVTRPAIDWRELAKAFNTILNVADRIKDGSNIDQIEQQIAPQSIRRDTDYSHDGMRSTRAVALVGVLGTQRVKQVGGGGCPPNRGLDFTDGLTGTLSVYDGAELIQDIFANSPGLFALNLEETTWEYHTGNCVVCNAENTDVGPCSICKDCEKKF